MFAALSYLCLNFFDNIFECFESGDADTVNLVLVELLDFPVE